jgi:hypothetical protein
LQLHLPAGCRAAHCHTEQCHRSTALKVLGSSPAPHTVFLMPQQRQPQCVVPQRGGWSAQWNSWQMLFVTPDAVCGYVLGQPAAPATPAPASAAPSLAT